MCGIFSRAAVYGNATVKIFLISKRVFKELKFKYRLKVLFFFFSWLKRSRKKKTTTQTNLCHTEWRAPEYWGKASICCRVVAEIRLLAPMCRHLICHLFSEKLNNVSIEKPVWKKEIERGLRLSSRNSDAIAGSGHILIVIKWMANEKFTWWRKFNKKYVRSCSRWKKEVTKKKGKKNIYFVGVEVWNFLSPITANS